MVLEECRVWVRFTGTVIATPPGITAFPQPGIMPCSGSSVHLIGRLRARFRPLGVTVSEFCFYFLVMGLCFSSNGVRSRGCFSSIFTFLLALSPTYHFLIWE
ncbi:hypothetical protein M758_9G010600 [Ceratodon purpureus]|nr:hypothetical protein M758_9G010600 [Ceratodon purpureus]